MPLHSSPFLFPEQCVEGAVLVMSRVWGSSRVAVAWHFTACVFHLWCWFSNKTESTSDRRKKLTQMPFLYSQISFSLRGAEAWNYVYSSSLPPSFTHSQSHEHTRCDMSRSSKGLLSTTASDKGSISNKGRGYCAAWIWINSSNVSATSCAVTPCVLSSWRQAHAFKDDSNWWNMREVMAFRINHAYIGYGKPSLQIFFSDPVIHIYS